MSAKKESWNVGELVRKSSLQRMADAGGTADDRALETLLTPGATQKKIVPLSEETATVNPRLLVVGKDTDATIANGVVRVRPAKFIGGVSGDAYSIGLSASLRAALDSAVFANNAGATRYDLLYGTISYGTPSTETVRQKPLSGGDPSSQSLTTQVDMTITLSIVPAVASGNPLASLPADPGDGSSYNFGLAMVAIPNAFAGGAINQAAITPLWGGGLVGHSRTRGIKPMSIYYGAAAERPGGALQSQVQGAERWGTVKTFFAHFKMLSTSGIVVLDNSIDWRNRFIYGFWTYLGNGNVSQVEALNDTLPAAPPETGGALGSALISPGILPPSWTGPGKSVTIGPLYPLWYTLTPNILNLGVTVAGTLATVFNFGPADVTHGDLFALVLYATDQLIAAV